MNLKRRAYILRFIFPAVLIFFLAGISSLFPGIFRESRIAVLAGTLLITGNLLYLMFRYVRQLEGSRIKMEKFYRETEKKHRIYVDTTADGFIFIREDGSMEVDNTILKITGYSTGEISDLSIKDLVAPDYDGGELFYFLEHGGDDITGLYEVRMIDRNGGAHEMILSLTEMESKGMKGTVLQVKDIGGDRKSTALKLSLAMEGQLLEMQAGMLFMNKPVGELALPPLICSSELPVWEAAGVMADNQKNSLIVSIPGKGYGIITDQDLRDRILIPGRDLSTPVGEVSTFPLITLPGDILFFEAFHKMREHHIRQVGIVNEGGELSGIITEKILMKLQGNSPYPVFGELNKAKSVQDLADVYTRLPGTLLTLVKLGADAQQISRMASRTAHMIGVKIVDMLLKEIGTPPCKFAVLALGSEGRGEQSLLTDQDNGILFEDVPENELEDTRNYFLKLGVRMNEDLDRVGYNLCKGGVMAGNPKWCRSLSEWKEDYRSWIHPEESVNNSVSLLEVNILFDFDILYGDRHLGRDLRMYMNSLKDDARRYYLMMAETASRFFTPPLTITGKIKISLTEEEDRVFNIKQALSPLVIYARLLSMKKGVLQTNTFERFRALMEIGEIDEEKFRELRHAYDYLLRLRFRNQIECLEDNVPMDNFIYVEDLLRIEEKTIIQIFQMIQGLQTSIKIYFTGSIR